MEAHVHNSTHVHFLNDFHSELTAHLLLKKMKVEEEKTASFIESRRKELDEYYIKNIEFIRKCTLKSIAISNFTMNSIVQEGELIKSKIASELKHIP